MKEDAFGKKKIADIKTSDAKMWLLGLQDGGRSYSSIHNIRGVVRPAFAMAVEDDLLRKNPFDFELAKVLINDAVKRDAYLMGHADIATTMNVYTHLKLEDAKDELEQMKVSLTATDGLLTAQQYIEFYFLSVKQAYQADRHVQYSFRPHWLSLR